VTERAWFVMDLRMENLPNRTARPTAGQDDEDAIDVRLLTHRVLTMRGVEHMLWEERSRG
jgi:hypothetical protein